MKILHTSDWHLGHVLYHYDREEEQTAFLLQLEQIVRQEQPDALLVSGDVFHTPAPSAATVKTYVSAMLALRSACPTMAIVMIAGNHDSASRIDCDRELWRVAGITVVGTVARGADDAAARHIIPVHDAGRQLLGTIVAVPHCYRLPADTFFADLLAMADRSRPVVLMAHLTMTGSDITGHDNIGMLDSVPPARVAGYDYVALGHIHAPQNILSERIRYCGTPLKYSFSEAKHEKSITVIDMNEKDSLSVRTVPLYPLRDMREIEGTYEELTYRPNYEGTNLNDYIHITLTDEEDIPDAIGKLRLIYPNLMCLDYNNSRTRAAGELSDLEDLERKSPLTLFEDFYEQQNGRPMSGEQEAFAKEIMENIWEEKL